jgi:citrate synthase
MKLVDNKATLSFSNGSPSVELPVYAGSIGPDVIDIRKLYAQTGMFTYDPGFLSTASCQSAITYIDGDKGELLYRGYPIEQLATSATTSTPATCCSTANCPTKPSATTSTSS